MALIVTAYPISAELDTIPRPLETLVVTKILLDTHGYFKSELATSTLLFSTRRKLKARMKKTYGKLLKKELSKTVPKCKPHVPKKEPAPKKALKTEDLGLTLEMALSLVFDIKYNGSFKYNMDIAKDLAERLAPLREMEMFSNMKHVASGGSPIDFTNGKTGLSAKTNKIGNHKVAPQVIGQASRKKFCSMINIDYKSDDCLKQYIQDYIKEILPVLAEHTFHCPIIYYNGTFDCIKLLNLKSPIQWQNYKYEWTRSVPVWNESSTLKVMGGDGEYKSLLEVQFHNNRPSLKLRWDFRRFFLDIFSKNFEIIEFE